VTHSIESQAGGQLRLLQNANKSHNLAYSIRIAVSILLQTGHRGRWRELDRGVENEDIGLRKVSVHPTDGPLRQVDGEFTLLLAVWEEKRPSI
jgi:hypothetical protein